MGSTAVHTQIEDKDDDEYEDEGSQQMVRIHIHAHLNLVWKGKAIHHFSDRSREPEDSSGTQQDLEPIKPFYPFDLGGDDWV